MKRVGDLMRELGFREEAPLSTKKAFIENLIRAANRDEALRGRPPLYPPITTRSEQLEFDFEAKCEVENDAGKQTRIEVKFGTAG